MPTSTHLDDLKINVLTESQFDAAVQGGTIGAGEISMITDLDEAIQVDTMPTAAASELGKIYQFTGTTGTYTHGYFYECVSDGGNPATYSWSQTNVQPAGSSLPSQTGNSGKFLTTNGTDASWAAVDAIQVSAMPVAAVGELDKIYQFVGTTDANYTNGYFYKCVSDGQNPATYSWTRTDVQPGSSLPSQSGKDGKFLYTNGAVLSWQNAVKNNSSQNNSIVIGNSATAGSSNYSTGVGASSVSGYYGTAVGYLARANGSYSVAVGEESQTGSSATSAVAIGAEATATGQQSIAIGIRSYATATYSIQLGAGTNSTANTLSVGLSNSTNYRLLDSNGTIPTDRYTTTPSADGTYVPTLTIASGVATRSWSAPGGGGSVPTLTWYSVSTAGNTLTIADTSSAQLVKIYKNGLLLQPTEDYTISGTTLTTVGALVVGDKITTEVF